MLVFARHEQVLRKLGLTTLDAIRAFQGNVVKNHHGRRDILRIPTADEMGRPLVLFIKRNWNPHKKDGLHSLARRGRVWSLSRQEWENSLSLQRAGLTTVPLVAFGEECGWLWERFSFLITEAARGTQTVQQFLGSCQCPARRRRVLDSLARSVRLLHQGGLALPDFFTRHIFVDETAAIPVFHLIDVARLDGKRPVPLKWRARDLAALNITAPLRHVSIRERVRFLHVYGGGIDRRLIPLIEERMTRWIGCKRFTDFSKGGDAIVCSCAEHHPPRMTNRHPAVRSNLRLLPQAFKE